MECGYGAGNCTPGTTGQVGGSISTGTVQHPQDGSLPFTGGDAFGLGGLGLVLVVIGACLHIRGRRHGLVR